MEGLLTTKYKYSIQYCPCLCDGVSLVRAVWDDGCKLGYYYLHREVRSMQAFRCYRKWWPWMTLNGVMAVILHHCT